MSLSSDPVGASRQGGTSCPYTEFRTWGVPLEKFEVIIVGAGLAGLSAAYTLAKEGIEAMVIERGDYPGAKNMTGGRFTPTRCGPSIPSSGRRPPSSAR